MSMDNVIAAAAADIADSLSGGDMRRRAAMRNFLESALWAAASCAEDLPQSAWINPKADDSWLKSAADDRFPLPDTMTPEQFMEVSELLGTGKEALEKMIGTRIKLQPELKAAVEGIVGPGHASPAIMPKPSPAPTPAPEHHAPEKKEPAPKPELDDSASPAKRKDPIKRDDVEPRVDEFEGDISKNPHLPGAPEAR